MLNRPYVRLGILFSDIEIRRLVFVCPFLLSGSTLHIHIGRVRFAEGVRGIESHSLFDPLLIAFYVTV